MEIRSLTPADAEAYQALVIEGARVLPASFGVSHEELLAEPMDAVRERLRHDGDPAGRVFGAFDEAGTLAGVVSVRQYSLRKMRHKGTLGRMFVAPEFRRLGLARRLLDTALAFAREIGLEQLTLIVDEKNEAARRLYDSYGFVAFGIEPRELKIGDTYCDSMHMWLPLDAPPNRDVLPGNGDGGN